MRGIALSLESPSRLKLLASNRLERRLLEIENLDPKAKRQITQLLDTFIEHEKVKCKLPRAWPSSTAWKPNV